AHPEAVYEFSSRLVAGQTRQTSRQGFGESPPQSQEHQGYGQRLSRGPPDGERVESETCEDERDRQSCAQEPDERLRLRQKLKVLKSLQHGLKDAQRERHDEREEHDEQR